MNKKKLTADWLPQAYEAYKMDWMRRKGLSLDDYASAYTDFLASYPYGNRSKEVLCGFNEEKGVYRFFSYWDTPEGLKDGCVLAISVHEDAAFPGLEGKGYDLLEDAGFPSTSLIFDTEGEKGVVAARDNERIIISPFDSKSETAFRIAREHARKEIAGKIDKAWMESGFSGECYASFDDFRSVVFRQEQLPEDALGLGDSSIQNRIEDYVASILPGAEKASYLAELPLPTTVSELQNWCSPYGVTLKEIGKILDLSSQAGTDISIPSRLVRGFIEEERVGRHLVYSFLPTGISAEIEFNHLDDDIEKETTPVRFCVVRWGDILCHADLNSWRDNSPVFYITVYAPEEGCAEQPMQNGFKTNLLGGFFLKDDEFGNRKRYSSNDFCQFLAPALKTFVSGNGMTELLSRSGRFWDMRAKFMQTNGVKSERDAKQQQQTR